MREILLPHIYLKEIHPPHKFMVRWSCLQTHHLLALLVRYLTYLVMIWWFYYDFLVFYWYFVLTVLTSKRTRGLTCGIGVQTLVDKEEKLSVPFPQDYCAPVGKNACKLSSQLGVLVCTSMSDLNVCRWSMVPDSIKQPIMQRIEVVHDLLTHCCHYFLF